ncbi:PREDICTED: amphoterin-induced protein 1-like [Cyprinodon variegatus]|uniref:amphoterin-induced protein 1-like n=1 Tax=Cyprinodon variegatus TaxID=28743 RepID=UPI0007428337|nr:PREDICTED: amphoterin-induced protein 1-like [Cyprinodon variegatus]XP_015231539.1 PREDICTED: amphoterin-induced protein 1-like [Cyprinodon variegatus]
MRASRRCFLLFLHLALVFPVVRVNRLLKRKSLDHKRLCVCAINIISCSNLHLENVTLNLPNHTSVLDLSFNNITKLLATWTLTDLNMLQTMLLNNNRLTFLSSEAFVHVKKLRYLDLSYNGLTLLDEFIFEPLEDLEVLVLFKNHISKIDRTAFSSMGALQKLYMSHNQISRIPLEVLKERSKLDTFKLLDVSFNKIKDLPIKELQSMRAWMKNGVYFHNNPLTCSCELYKLVASWDIRMLSSVSGFADNHTCTMPDKKTKEILNITCNDDKILIREANLEQKLLLDCDTRQKYMEKRWVLPGNISASSANNTKIKEGGTYLEIGPLKLEDSGVYTCYANNSSLIDTVQITVVVLNYTKSHGLEDLKTAYTTLGACVISVVLILVYLYVTPHCCACWSGENTEKDDPGESLHSSTASLPLAHGEQEAENGAFAFRYEASQESKDQLELNGRLNPIGEEDDEWSRDSRNK